MNSTEPLIKTSNEIPFSVIIVVKNNEKGIEKTLVSLSSQINNDFNVIIVDGKSTDETLNIAASYQDSFKSCKIISEKDRGIFHAMNKGIEIANESFLIFLNSGDILFDKYTFVKISKCIIEDKFLHDVYYGNTIFRYDNYDDLRDANIYKNKFIHQSIVYRKNLHSEFGNYIESKPLTISDYIFFKNISPDRFLKLDIVISINEPGGISDSLNSFRQYIFFNYLHGDITFLRMMFIFTLYPIYKILKKILNNLKN
jgi:glycosyltransferase involved in cell wall biosynthesis